MSLENHASSHNPRSLDPDPSKCLFEVVFASYPEFEIEGPTLCTVLLYTRYAFNDAEWGAPSDSDIVIHHRRGRKSCQLH